MCSHGRRQDALHYLWWVSGTKTREEGRESCSHGILVGAT